MLLSKVLTTFKFQNGSEGIIQTTDEAVEYFGIDIITPLPRLLHRKGYSYQRLTGNDFKEIKVPSSRYTISPQFNKRHVRRIKVPRGTFTEKGSEKTFSFSFPKRVKNLEISFWLSERCQKHKPLYFLTEAGRACPVWDFSKVLYHQ